MQLINLHELFIGDTEKKVTVSKVTPHIQRGDESVIIPVREIPVDDLHNFFESVNRDRRLTHAVLGKGSDQRLVLAMRYLPATDQIELLYSRTSAVDYVRNEVTSEALYIETIQLNDDYIPICVAPEYRNLNWGIIDELKPCTIEHFTQWLHNGGQRWAGMGFTRLDLTLLKRYLESDMSVTLDMCFRTHMFTSEVFFDIAPNRKPKHYLSLGTEWNPKHIDHRKLVAVLGDNVPKLKSSNFKSINFINQL